VNPSDILDRVLAGGGRVIAEPEGPRLFVPRTLRPLVEEHREALRDFLRSASGRSIRREDGRFAAAIAKVLELPLSRFGQEGPSLEVRVAWLPVTLWFAPDDVEARRLAREGISRGRIWTASELIDALRPPEMDPQELRVVATVKLTFGGDIVAVRMLDTGEVCDAAPSCLEGLSDFHRKAALEWWQQTGVCSICGAEHDYQE
jgi:hypothetical protein